MGSLVTCVCKADNQMKEELSKSLTLYDKIGGDQAVDAVVDIFYEKILEDDKIRPFFYRTAMQTQRMHLKQFLCSVLGGPTEYKGNTLYEAHHGARSMGLNEEIFKSVTQYLAATLVDLQVEQTEIDKIGEIVGTVKDDILGTSKLFPYNADEDCVVVVTAAVTPTVSDSVSTGDQVQSVKPEVNRLSFYGSYVDNLVAKNTKEPPLELKHIESTKL